MTCVIGIDLGTSGVKAVLIGGDGDELAILGVRASSYSPDVADGGCVQQEPSVWWEHTRAVLRELTRDFPDAEIAALAVSGQMHSSVFLDADGGVIRPALLWNDTRTTEQTREIIELCGGEARLLELVQNRALEGFTLPKILWLRKHEPQNFARLDKVVMPKDYINYRLTGRIATEVSDAAGTLLWDTRARTWSLEMVAAMGLDASLLPTVLESLDVVGVVAADIARELGLPNGVRVIAGGADNSCGAVANGILEPGQAMVSVGTSGTVVAYLDALEGDVTGEVHLFSYSAPEADYAMGCMLSAGQCLNWLKENILTQYGYDELNALAEASPCGANGLVFLPYLFGERCPHPDADARGVFFGLGAATSAGDMARAVLEGVALNFAEMLALVERFAPVRELYLTGGGARSAVWRQILADVLGRELIVSNVEEGAALGAGMLALVGAGLAPSLKSAGERLISRDRVIVPNRDNAAVYAKSARVFSALYAAARDVFKLNK
ncbi:MAG: xylulokinase [Oscillospiraceae bacterium]|jgi:xylulokinase|nr:xylulokinase [Oscillospiraceae bacterium]